MLWAKLERWVSGRRFAWHAAALAIALSLPALGNGLVVDDHFLRATNLGLNPPGLVFATKWDLFRFYPGPSALQSSWAELGIFPWWASPELAVSFWRPVVSALHRLDFVVWPSHPALMHAHSLAWLGALVLAVGALFRRLHGSGFAAGLALLLFAVDDGHALPIGWLANRNALVASFFAVLAPLAHDRFRRDGWKPGALLAPLALGLGLLSGEIALGGIGGVVAHALVFEEGWRKRLAAMAPSLALVLVWRIAYSRLGYGAHGSGLYLDPVVSPLAFIRALGERWPLLVFAQLGGFPSDVWTFTPRPLGAGLAFLAVLGCGLLAAGLFRLLRADRLARFHALWLALATLPACATFPNDRLLVLASVAGAGLVARAIEEWRKRGLVGKPLGVAFVALHLVAAPLLLPPRVYSMRLLGELGNRIASEIPRDVAGRTLVVLNAPDGLLCVHLIAGGASLGLTLPARLRCVGVTLDGVTISRPSERTLMVATSSGFLDSPMDTLFRSEDLPFEVGRGASTKSVPIRVTALTPEGRPRELSVDFEAPLDSAAFSLVVWHGSGYEPFTLPPVGGQVVVPATSYSEIFARR